MIFRHNGVWWPLGGQGAKEESCGLKEHSWIMLPVRLDTFTAPCALAWQQRQRRKRDAYPPPDPPALSQDHKIKVQSGGPPWVIRNLFSAEKAAQTYSRASALPSTARSVPVISRNRSVIKHCFTQLDCKLNSSHLVSEDPSTYNQPNEPSGITIAVGELTSSSLPGGDVVDIAHSSFLELFTHLGCGEHDHDSQRQHSSGKRTRRQQSFPFHLS